MRIINKNVKTSRDRTKNFLVHESYTYKINNAQYRPGFNSSIFVLKDPNGVYPNRILKICKFDSKNSSKKKRIERFQREIRALNTAKARKCKNIIEYFFDGQIEIERKVYSYYVMEKADCNLKEYMLDLDNELDIQEKLKFCREISNGIKELHDIGIYHRDIKPENILFTGNAWKIGDLGLIAKRNEDFDDQCEMIGPTGWLSPEVMNKVYTENQDIEYQFDCKIDEKSDIFQLGKLFWFIFQGNVPIGQIRHSDFQPNRNDIFKMIEKMLQYSKSRRFKMARIQKQFHLLERKYAI